MYNDRDLHLFSLLYRTGEVKNSFKLSKEFEDKKIEPVLIDQVNEILMRRKMVNLKSFM